MHFQASNMVRVSVTDFLRNWSFFIDELVSFNRETGVFQNGTYRLFTVFRLPPLSANTVDTFDTFSEIH